MKNRITIVKHATNQEIEECIILQCPYCHFRINSTPFNFKRIKTHIRCKHLKDFFPPKTIFTKDKYAENNKEFKEEKKV